MAALSLYLQHIKIIYEFLLKKDLRLQHDEGWCVTLRLFVEVIPQCTRLISLDGFGGLGQKLFNLAKNQ
jgi:hypothetical protein